MLLHLYQYSGSQFYFWDAKDPNKKGHIPDGALVYLIISSNDVIYYTAVEVDEKKGFVKMAEWKKPGQANYAKPLGFIYKAKEIVEV